MPEPDFTSVPSYVNGAAAASRRSTDVVLRPQQRLSTASVTPGAVISVGKGMLSIDAMATKGQRQILDFVMAGEIFSLTPVMERPGVSIRAITPSVLHCAPMSAAEEADGESDVRDVLLANSRSQVARSYVHQLMIGHLEAEARVASCLLVLALREAGSLQGPMVLPLPMSRDDIADYLSMNRDTLSRVLARMETTHLIERLSRHAIRIVDLDRLMAMTPIAAQIEAACVSEERNGPALQRTWST